MQNVANRHTSAAESLRVGVVGDFHYVAVNVCCVCGEEPFYVVPVNGQAPVKAETVTDRLQAAQTAKTHPAYGRPFRQSLVVAP